MDKNPPEADCALLLPTGLLSWPMPHVDGTATKDAEA